MITKKDIKDLCGKAILLYKTSINLETFLDIYENDMEWNDMKDLANDIAEFLHDNLDLSIEYMNDYIEYIININGKKVEVNNRG